MSDANNSHFTNLYNLSGTLENILINLNSLLFHFHDINNKQYTQCSKNPCELQHVNFSNIAHSIQFPVTRNGSISGNSSVKDDDDNFIVESDFTPAIVHLKYFGPVAILQPYIFPTTGLVNPQFILSSAIKFKISGRNAIDAVFISNILSFNGIDQNIDEWFGHIYYAANIDKWVKIVLYNTYT
jgi:hypothetical protein